MDDSTIGKKIIETAINFDESLVEILKIEVKRVKQLLKNNCDPMELQKTSKLIKYIIMALIITDEKIKAGIDFYMSSNETKKSEPFL